jgi:hypothetical protein
MPAPRTKLAPTQTANVVKRGGIYRLYMLVEGRWLETGITSRKFLEITQIADREFSIVHINAPMDVPPPLPAAATAQKKAEREGASEKEKTPAS